MRHRSCNDAAVPHAILRQGWDLMSSIALVGPEFEENLSLRYLASSLSQAGYEAELLVLNRESDLPRIVDRIVHAPVPPSLVGLSLAFQWRAKDFLALAMAL